MNAHVSQASTLGAIILGVVLVAVVAGLAAGLGNPRWRWVVLAVAVGGGLFQVGHFGEHIAQAGYWTMHTDAAPWMTPWARHRADSFGRLAPGTPTFGMEALHLVGNAIFLAGALAVGVAVGRDGPAASQRPARVGVVVQAVHVIEHVALTVSVVVGSRARGVSTLFGLLDPGPTLWTYRVWWHLAINTVATVLLGIAVVRWRRGANPGIATHSPAYAAS